MLEHFVESIKMSKGARQEAIQINIYTALLLALRTLAELKSSLGQETVKNIATELIIVSYCYSIKKTNENPIWNEIWKWRFHWNI